MPKKTLVLSDFSGGLNDYKDARDIEYNEVSSLFNAHLGLDGRITTCGMHLTQPHTNDNPLTNTTTAGWGLYAFVYAFNMDASPVAKDTQFIAINDGSEIDIYDYGKSGGAAWRTAEINLG